MKDKLIFLFRKLYYLKDKIAFYPSLLALLGFVFTYIMIYLEEEEIVSLVLDTEGAITNKKYINFIKSIS